MPNARTVQASFTSGEFDPLLAAREDVKFYYSAAALMSDVLALPQGGFKRRPGMPHLAEHVDTLSSVSLGGANVTAPEGGTAANVHDGDETTYLTTANDIDSADPFVIAHVDFTTPTAIDFVDVVNISLAAGSFSDGLFIQYSTDDIAWSNFGPAFNVSSDDRTRRRRGDPAVTAQYWRVARIAGAPPTTKVKIAEIRFWVQSGALSESRTLGFAFSTEAIYQIYASDRNLEIFDNATDTRVASVNIPHLDADLSSLYWTQSYDTLLLYHVDHPIWRVFRQGSSDEWDSAAAPIINPPCYEFVEYPDGVVTMNPSATSGAITITASAATFTADMIEWEIELPGGYARITGYTSPTVVNADVIDALSASVATTEWILLEPIWSDARGYPACGTFYQGRHIVGGPKSLPLAIAFSASGQFFDFDRGLALSGDGFFVQADTDQVSAIRSIHAGRNLQIFTSGAEFYIPTEPITPTNIALKMTTRRGIQAGTRPHDIDGATAFVQQGGKALRGYLFDDLEQSYKAQHLSLLSSHLLNNPIDLAIQKATALDEADFLGIVNSDGTMPVLTTLREQAVSAFVRTSTHGRIKSVYGEDLGSLYMVVERTINGVDRRFIEKWDPAQYLDGGGVVAITAENFVATAAQTVFNYTFASPGSSDYVGVKQNGVELEEITDYTVSLGGQTVTLVVGATEDDDIRIALKEDTVSGLDHLEAEEINVYVDGSPEGTVTVSSGSFTLESPADTEIQYGFNFIPHVRTLPFRAATDAGPITGERVRIIDATITVYQTSNIAVGANDGPTREIPIRTLGDDLLDRSMEEVAATGNLRISGFMGWTRSGQLDIVQNEPGPFTVLAATYKVAV